MIAPTRPWNPPAHTRPWPIPAPAASDGSVTFHHISDTHTDYRPWSRDEMDHMRRDIQDERIPPVHGTVFTGDLIEGNPAADCYTRTWMLDVARDAPGLWCVGNHDLRERVPTTRAAWERSYGRPANTYVDLAGWRFVTCAPDSHRWNEPWVIPAATWEWMDGVVSSAPGPVVLANHFPLQEIGVGSPNYIEPASVAADFISSHPNIAGYVAGHMHPEIGTPRARQFVTVGNRPRFPTVMGISAMLSLSGLSRDQSSQLPSISSYVTLREDRWEIRYRMHGTRSWSGPDGYRLTVMHLNTGLIEHTM